MAFYRNLITAAIAMKQRQPFPPDLMGNGPDSLLNAPLVSPAADAIRAAWFPAIGNQAAPAYDFYRGTTERGYYEELPWDE